MMIYRITNKIFCNLKCNFDTKHVVIFLQPTLQRKGNRINPTISHKTTTAINKKFFMSYFNIIIFLIKEVF